MNTTLCGTEEAEKGWTIFLPSPPAYELNYTLAERGATSTNILHHDVIGAGKFDDRSTNVKLIGSSYGGERL